MKNWLFLLALVFCLSGCAKTIEFVPPPLQDPPLLKSTQIHKGSQGESRFCLDRPDFEATMNFFEHVRHVKEKWK